MNHNFSIKIAEMYGLEEAIMISNFQYWITKNKANGNHYYDGRTWTYNSVKAFEDLFPYLTPSKIRRCLESLIEQGVLIKGDYNKNRYVRTSWFAFANESMFLNQQMDLSDLTNGNGEKDKCITDINPNVKPYNIPPISPKGELIVKKQRAEKSSLTSPEQIEAFDQFRKLFSGTKRGLATELACFQKHKDWAEVLPCLSQRLQAEITDRENKRKRNLFTPPWPHLSTYLNQRRWEAYAPENIPAPATDYKLNLGLVYPKDEQQGKEQIRIMAEVIGYRNCTQRELEWAYDFQRPYAIKLNDYPIHHYLHNRGLAGTVNDPDDALTVIAHINAQ